MQDVAGGHRIPDPTLDLGAQGLAVAAAAPLADERAAHQQSRFTALDEDDVLDVLVLLRDAVRVSANESETMGTAGVAVLGERLARRVVRAYPRAEGRAPPCQIRCAPVDKAGWLGLQGRKKRHRDQDRGETEGHEYRTATGSP